MPNNGASSWEERTARLAAASIDAPPPPRTDTTSIQRGREVPAVVLAPGWGPIAVRLPDDAGAKIHKHMRALEQAYPASRGKPGVGLALVVRLVRDRNGEWTAQVTPEIPSERIGRDRSGTPHQVK